MWVQVYIHFIYLGIVYDFTQVFLPVTKKWNIFKRNINFYEGLNLQFLRYVDIWYSAVNYRIPTNQFLIFLSIPKMNNCRLLKCLPFSIHGKILNYFNSFWAMIIFLNFVNYLTASVITFVIMFLWVSKKKKLG